MNAEILCVGTELLHGDIVNTNAQYISKKFAEIGIDVHFHTVVGDNHDRMKDAFYLAFSRADIVICTGGLGPTKDDITKEILAEFFHLDMVFDEDSYEHLINKYQKFRKSMPENNMRQTYFPAGAKIITNDNGTANACILKQKIESGEIKIGILLPGPPKEMTPLMDEQIIPYLMEFTHEVVVGKKIIVMNIGESAAEEMIMDLIDNQTNPTIAPYASAGKVIFRVTAKAKSSEKALALIEPIEKELLKRFGSNAFVSESGNLEDKTAQLLIDKNITISVAESCTGGMVASKLINYPGISKVFKEGFITYTNEAKIKRLNVKKETIDKYGAVSEETAKEMAEGVKNITGSDIGISTTGIAGPDGGTPDKPVGLVFVAIHYKDETRIKQLNATGTRETVRERASVAILEMIREAIMS